MLDQQKSILIIHHKPSIIIMLYINIIFIQFMKKDSIITSLIPNIFELEQQPFLKKECAGWKRFKDKQTFLPVFRSITYQAQSIMSKIFLFHINEQIKDKKLKRELLVFTEKQIITLQQLYQMLNENSDQKSFNQDVSNIKQFQASTKRYIQALLGRHLITYKVNQQFLSFNVYKSGEVFCIKAAFNNYNYKFQYAQTSQIKEMPPPLIIKNPLVKDQLQKYHYNYVSMVSSIKVTEDLIKLYKNFYDLTYFHYDQFVLKLQVFNNFPLLRAKHYIPINFVDHKTQQPLEGPIFSNSALDCMYEHFTGFNADSTKFLQGGICQSCQIPFQQFQQNQLLMTLRDNICNPQKSNIAYCPEFNRFKILSVCQSMGFAQKTLKYLNYYHFRLNIKKMTNKNRISFYFNIAEEIVPLSFTLNNRQLFIMDPARGKNCQHYSFTDLRLYYQTYDAESNMYRCPIHGCSQQMRDSDILYLKEVEILLKYASFKCQKNGDLLNHSTVIISHSKAKVYLSYRTRQQNNINSILKTDQILQFYKSLADPYIPFAEYTLGIKDKERQQKRNQYMFGGWRGEMQQQIQQEQQEQIEDD